MIGALLSLSPAERLAAALGGASLLVISGAAGALAWEHRTPWGLEAKRAQLEDQIEAPITGWKARLHATEAQRDNWFSLYKKCENARSKEQSDAADAVTRASDQRAAASSAAFNQGYAAGRAVGLQRCGGNLASQENSSDPGGVPGPGGLRDGETDLSSLFGVGSYQPGSAGAGGPGRAQ